MKNTLIMSATIALLLFCHLLQAQEKKEKSFIDISLFNRVNVTQVARDSILHKKITRIERCEKNTSRKIKTVDRKVDSMGRFLYLNFPALRTELATLSKGVGEVKVSVDSLEAWGKQNDSLSGVCSFLSDSITKSYVNHGFHKDRGEMYDVVRMIPGVWSDTVFITGDLYETHLSNDTAKVLLGVCLGTGQWIFSEKRYSESRTCKIPDMKKIIFLSNVPMDAVVIQRSRAVWKKMLKSHTKEWFKKLFSS